MRSALLAFLVFVLQTYATDVVWHHPAQGSFMWRDISVTEDGVFLPSYGAISRSADGENWDLHYQRFDAFFFSIAQSPEKFVAAAALGNPPDSAGRPAFLISTNGVDFNFAKDAPHHVWAIAYGNGRFVAAGYEMSWSTNGLDWNRITGPPATDVFEPGSLLFGGGKFLRATPNGIYVSENGIFWQQTSSENVKQVSSYNGRYAFIARGKIGFSDDAREWRTNAFTQMAYPYTITIGDPGVIVSGGTDDRPGRNMSVFSADGTNWVQFTLPFGTPAGGAKFVNGRYLMAGNGVIARSADGTNWTSNTSTPPVRLLATAKGGDRLIGVGVNSNARDEGAGMWSTNGLNWQPLNLHAPRMFTDIAYRDGTFVAMPVEGQMRTSTNAGVDWVEAPTPVTGQSHYRVIGTPRGFLAVGYQAVIFSEDGLNWEKLSMPISFGFAGVLAYGNGIYLVGAGFEGLGQPRILKSTDLREWTLVPWPDRNPEKILFGNGKFVTMTSGSVSSDAVHWERGNGPGLTAMTFSDGVFCGTIGGQNWYESVRGYASVDGLHWHPLFEMPSLGISAQYRFGRFLGLCVNAGVFEVKNFAFLDLVRNSDGSLNVQRLQPGVALLELETSVDLTSWDNLAEPAVLPSDERRFYRPKPKLISAP